MSAPQSTRNHSCSRRQRGQRELLCFAGRRGYQVVCAADGQQALARVNSDSIGLALLDVVMPRRPDSKFVKR